MGKRKGPKPQLKEQRFWSKVKKLEGEDACWLWVGGNRKPDKTGYGNFCWEGRRPNGNPDTIGAHVASYRLNVGDVPEGTYVLHTCDNPPCVRPSHLFLGNAKVNMDDCFNKGRHSYRFEEKPFIGSEHPEAKLDEDKVREIKRLLPILKNGKIAKIYDVSEACIWLIRKGRAWRHVEAA